MSARECEFVFPLAEDEVAKAPRADRGVNPVERVQAFAYKSGHVELRSARDGEWLNTDLPVHTRDFR